MQIYVDMEEWRSIEEFNYEISNLGRVRRSTGEANTWEGRILKLKTDKDGYHIAALYREGKRFDRKVHRLVCFAFNGPPISPELEARHLDGIPSNNIPTNLKWGTSKHNAADRDRHNTTRRGGNHSKALFSDSAVNKMREQYNSEKARAIAAGKKYVSHGFINSLAIKHSVDRSTLHRILSGVGY